MRRVVVLVLVLAACQVPAPSASVTPLASFVSAVPTSPPTFIASPAPPSPTPGIPSPTATPLPPLDAQTASSLAIIDNWCLTLPPGSRAMPLGAIGRIANGRSARETVEALARSTCLLQQRAYGDGANEVVTVGAYRSDGAVLWVDRGYWRIAPVPIDYGYLTLRWDVQRAAQRELFFEIWSGGSAGARGYLAIGITGDSAAMTLHAAPGASQMFAQRLGGEDVLLTGRKLPERRWGFDSNCCLPGGREWLWHWTTAGYTLIGERQVRDSYYALNALLGAIDSGHAETASDVATRSAIAAAVAFFGPGRLWTYKPSPNASAQQQAELMRWSLLPGAEPIAAAAVRYEVARYEPAGQSAVITFERVGDGWLATDVRAGTLP